MLSRRIFFSRNLSIFVAQATETQNITKGNLTQSGLGRSSKGNFKFLNKPSSESDRRRKNTCPSFYVEDLDEWVLKKSFI